MKGSPRIQITIREDLFDRCHAHAQQLGITTSAWLRRLLVSWDGHIPVVHTKELSVRLDAFHLQQLDSLATRSQVSRSKAFAFLIEKALDSGETMPMVQSRPVIPALDAYKEWAELVIRAAMDTPQKFGERRAFISGVIEELQARLRPAEPANFSAMIKRILLQLNRLDLLRLTRADLIPVMNPEWVAASEIHYSVATFHFVDLSRYLPESWEVPQ